jgi:hypothetical protein
MTDTGNVESIAPGSIKMQALEKSMRELTDLFTMKAAASTAYNDAVKRIAEQSGIDAQVIKTYVSAVVNDEEAKFHKRADQLSLVFEEAPGSV